MKDVLIFSFQGIVRINHVPNCITRLELIDKARYLLATRRVVRLIELTNVEYLVNDRIDELLEAIFGDIDNTPDDFYDFEVEWEEIK